MNAPFYASNHIEYGEDNMLENIIIQGKKNFTLRIKSILRKQIYGKQNSYVCQNLSNIDAIFFLFLLGKLRRKNELLSIFWNCVMSDIVGLFLLNFAYNFACVFATHANVSECIIVNKTEHKDQVHDIYVLMNVCLIFLNYFYSLKCVDKKYCTLFSQCLNCQ